MNCIHIKKNYVESAFPNIFIALQLYLTLPVSNCTGERSFSLLKRINNALRSTMGQECLSSLAILSIESELVRQIDFSTLIANFAELNSRRKPVKKLQCCILCSGCNCIKLLRCMYMYVKVHLDIIIIYVDYIHVWPQIAE